MIDLDTALTGMLAPVAPKADFDARLQARLDTLRQQRSEMALEASLQQARAAYQVARTRLRRQVRAAILASVALGLAALIAVLIIDADWRRITVAISSGVALLGATDPLVTCAILAVLVMAARPAWWCTARAALLE